MPNSEDLIKSVKINDNKVSNKNFVYSLDNNINVVKIVDNGNVIKNITGNILRIKTYDATTELYAFRNLLEIESFPDATSNYIIDNLGNVNDYLTYDNIMLSPVNNNIIMRLGKEVFGSLHKITFNIKFEDMIKFINDNNFIYFTNNSRQMLSFLGKPILPVSSISDIYTLLSNMLQNEKLDLDYIDNGTNTYINNICTIQNTVNKQLFAVVVDGADNHILFEVPYKTFKFYDKINPIVTPNIKSFTIDHFVDEDGTVYTKESIDYMVLNVNEKLFDFKLDVIFDLVLINENRLNNFWAITYNLDTISNISSYYSDINTYLETSLFNIDSTNINITNLDSTTILLDANDTDYNMKLEIPSLSLKSTDELVINIESTGATLSSHLGHKNILDNVLYNDGVAINFGGATGSLYIDYISKSIEL
jgi:hypothetical protein